MFRMFGGSLLVSIGTLLLDSTGIVYGMPVALSQIDDYQFDYQLAQTVEEKKKEAGPAKPAAAQQKKADKKAKDEKKCAHKVSPKRILKKNKKIEQIGQLKQDIVLRHDQTKTDKSKLEGEVQKLLKITDDTLTSMEASTMSFGKIIEGITSKFDKISADAEASVPVSSNPTPAPTAIPAPKIKMPVPPPTLAKPAAPAAKPDGDKAKAKAEGAKPDAEKQDKAPETPAPEKK